MELDLHGMKLWEAMEEIGYRLEECKVKGARQITLIHGHHGKAVLKDYIRSKGFLKEMKREGHSLKRLKSSNPGVSIFELR